MRNTPPICISDRRWEKNSRSAPPSAFEKIVGLLRTWLT